MPSHLVRIRQVASAAERKAIPGSRAMRCPRARERSRISQWWLASMLGYGGSNWPHHDGLIWPHPLVVVAAGMVVSA